MIKFNLYQRGPENRLFNLGSFERVKDVDTLKRLIPGFNSTLTVWGGFPVKYDTKSRKLICSKDSNINTGCIHRNHASQLMEEISPNRPDYRAAWFLSKERAEEFINEFGSLTYKKSREFINNNWPRNLIFI